MPCARHSSDHSPETPSYSPTSDSTSPQSTRSRNGLPSTARVRQNFVKYNNPVRLAEMTSAVTPPTTIGCSYPPYAQRNVTTCRQASHILSVIELSGIPVWKRRVRNAG